MREVTQVIGGAYLSVHGPRGWGRLGFHLADNWLAGIGLAIAVGSAYFLVARLSLGLLMKPDGVAVFWPAAGISSGVLIALGPRARWFVALGVVIGTIPANLLGDRDIWATVVFALSNAGEALITAAFIQRCFGVGFSLNRLRNVLGLFAAAAVGTTVSGIGGAIGYKLFHSPTVPMLTTWLHWFTSDALGIVAVAPVMIGVATVVREPPRRGEVFESFLVLALLAAMTGLIIFTPGRSRGRRIVPGALPVSSCCCGLPPEVARSSPRLAPSWFASQSFGPSFSALATLATPASRCQTVSSRPRRLSWQSHSAHSSSLRYFPSVA